MSLAGRGRKSAAALLLASTEQRVSDPISGPASEQEAAPDPKLDVLNLGGARAPLGMRDLDRDRTFKIAMTLAALLHAAVFISLINGHKPRSIGNPDGSSEAISVSILSEKDLKSRSAVEDAANAPRQGPVAPVPPPLKPTVETPPPEPEAKPAEAPPPDPAPEPPREEPQTEAKTAEPAPQKEEVSEFETKTERAEEKAEKQADKQAAIAPPAPTMADEALKNLLESTDPLEPAKRKTEDVQKKDKEKASKPDAVKPDTKAPRQQKPDRQQAVPDMVMPGGGAGVQRPPGYTKSGENDAFARGVIRALQRTMPQLRDTFGTVTVRIDLDRNGNLAKVTVMKPSGVAGLDQSVAFAVQQSSFPLPPANATGADLTFFVRYVYN